MTIPCWKNNQLITADQCPCWSNDSLQSQSKGCWIITQCEIAALKAIRADLGRNKPVISQKVLADYGFQGVFRKESDESIAVISIGKGKS